MADREPARHPQSTKITHNCLPETQREKAHRKVQKRMRPEPLKHSFRIGGVMTIKISLLPENIPEMLTQRLHKWSWNPKQVRVWTPPKKHSESGCLKQCNMFENASPNGSQNRFKIDEKTHLGTPGTAEAHCGVPRKALEVPPGTKAHKNQPETCFRTRKLVEKRQRPQTFPRKPQSENWR